MKRENPSQVLKAKVACILRYKSFAELFRYNNAKKFGGESTEELLDQINRFYSNEDQVEFGVVGIEFELI